MYVICSELTKNIPMQRHWRCSGIFIDKFEQISRFDIFIADSKQVDAGWDWPQTS